MATLDKIKSRIASIKSTSKITKAMELVATAKIKKAKELFNKTQEYYTIIFNNVINVVNKISHSKSKYLNHKKGQTIWLVLSSDLGLCGGYNVNNIKKVKEQYQPGDVIFAIGQKAVNLAKTFKLEIVAQYTQIISKLEFKRASSIIENLLNVYNNNSHFTKVTLVASHFVNNVTFEPQAITLLPIQKQNLKDLKDIKKIISFHPIKQFEQSPIKIINLLIPMFLKYIFYAKIKEAKLIEQASRRVAMEAATKNANELLDGLKIEYNQQRQANITQEIAEIIAGANV